jgi:1-acyl-sn-glycerol-3-phosphate acyltransferase
MIRNIIWYLYWSLSLLVYIPAMIRGQGYVKRGEVPRARQLAFHKAKGWSRNLLKLAGGRTEIRGLENLPPEDAFLLVANHQSNFDIPLLLAEIPLPIAFIAKIETLKIPLVSQWMTFMGCLFMDREDFRQSVGIINEASKKMAQGYNYVIFPEGTRSPDGRLGDFKAGSIKMALKARRPILPVTIDGSIKMMKKGEKGIHPGRVVLTIHPPITPEEEIFKETVNLMAEIKTRIESALS